MQDFLRATKGISLEELISSPKATITKIQSDKRSAFLMGVAHYPNLPPRLPVAQDYPRVSYRNGTLLFVAIPYFGRETKSSMSFRREPTQIQIPDDRSQQEIIAEKLTAYPIVDGYNGQPPTNSSLSLFQYKFPLQSDTKVFEKWQTVLDAEEGGTEAEGELIVIHQALFMVFDNGLFFLVSNSFLLAYLPLLDTIAAFKSPNDLQSKNAPLYPMNCDSVGAYHALINIIYNILRSSEFSIPQKFRQIVSELVRLQPSSSNELITYCP